MKKIIFILITAILAGCSGQKSDDQIKAEITKTKEQIEELQKTLKTLESKLDSTKTEASNLIKVKVANMTQKEFDHFFEVSGVVEAKKKSFISPEMSGQIKKIHVSEGERVSQGDLLISLNTSVIANTLAETKSGLELATTMFKKQKELWDQGIGSEVEFLQAKNTKERLEIAVNTLQAQLRMGEIRAPFDGIVDGINAKEGEMGMPGYELVRMVNLAELEIKADVSERYIPVIKKDDLVNVTFPSYPDIEKNIPIKRTGNIINQANRTFQIQVDLANINGTIKPNSLAILRIKDYSNKQAFIVPSLVVKRDVTKKSFLFVARKENEGYVARKVFVTPGNSYKDQTEILEGLKPGDQVIIEGFNMISDGTNITPSL